MIDIINSDTDLILGNLWYDQNGNLVFQSGDGGNLISGDGYYREYDAFGQLTKIRTGSTNTSPVLEQYFYDADGQRIKIWKNDSANTTVYTPFKELMRITNLTGSYDFTYIYDGDTQVARKNSDGSIQFDHADHLGSVSVLTNQTANVIENTLYDPFGDVSSGGTKEVKLYTGHYSDEATNQYYYGQRYYKPNNGLFISPDPTIQYLFNPQSLNRYSYVMNNPYKYVDPTGLFALTFDAGTSAGGGPAAGSAALHIGFSYSSEHSLQIGSYGSESFGWAYLFGTEYYAGATLTPNAKKYSDLFGKSTTRGFSAAFGPGVSADRGVSHADSSIVSYSLAYSPGISAEVHNFETDSSGGSITVATPTQLSGLKNKLVSNNQQAANADSASKQSTKSGQGQGQGKVDKTINKIKETFNNVIKSVRNFFGGKK